MKRGLLTLLVGMALLLVAVPPAPTQTADRIRQFGFKTPELTTPTPPTKELIATLGTGDFQDRERATRQLLAQGVALIPELKEALAESSNPEATERLESLIHRIRVKQLFEPTRITLKLESATPRITFQELARVSGYQLPIPDDTKVKDLMSLDVWEKPFWEVVRTINHQSGIENYANNQKLDTDSVTPFVEVDGPFRITLESIHMCCTNQFSRPKNGTFRHDLDQFVSIRLESEPKLQMLGLSQIKLTRAVDNLGNNLLGTSDPEDEWQHSNRHTSLFLTHSEYFEVGVNRKDRTATEIVDLKGVAKVVVVREIRTDITVEKLQMTGKQTFPGQTFTLELEPARVDDQDRRFELAVTLTQNVRERYDKLELEALPARIIIENDQGDQAQIALTLLSKTVREGFARPNLESHFVQYKLTATAPPGVKASSFTRMRILDWECASKVIPFGFKKIPLS